MSNYNLVMKLFLQLGIILLACRVVSYLGVRYFKQTSVVCEMVAGILLGPSLFGLCFPEAQSWLFPIKDLVLANGQKIPNQSMSILFSISQIGVVIYMFIVGLEFNTKVLVKEFKSSTLILAFSVLTPFLLCLLISPFLFGYHDFFGPNITYSQATLFLGTCLAITAFPMLARILHENHLTKTRIGTITLGAALGGDLIIWFLLACILASITSDMHKCFFVIGGGIFYIFFMLYLGRKLASYQMNRFISFYGEKLTAPLISIIFSFVLFSAWATDFIGIYAVFGAFITGVILPRNTITNKLQKRVKYIAFSLLLPTFFAFSGLNTQINLIKTPELIMITVLIIVTAIIGKILGCALAARCSGETWNDSFIVGTLMNSRGLMELIILNIGITYGIIGHTLFTILILMAIVTSVMVSPAFYFLKRIQEVKITKLRSQPKFYSL